MAARRCSSLYPSAMLLLLLLALVVLVQHLPCSHSFLLPSASRKAKIHQGARTPASLQASNNNDRQDAIEEEKARIKILQARRQNVRGMLKAAESLRNFRLQNGFVPELDEATGERKDDENAKLAVTVTAFCVAAGSIALRVGGRAALVSATGLNFLTESPDIKDNLDQVLLAAEQMDPVQKAALFAGAWTLVKVFLFDAGGVVLALASGILFGGVLQGAIASAACATFGSTVGFLAAKADTPVRKKALEVLEDYPSLRGIEKVVAKDGVKAVLTLRLAPILPIPLGLYNYIYGVTNVPLLDFASGIFLGSLKPYLLDSYLGFFGMEVIQGGGSGDGGLQDYILLGALGVSVLIGVFASQLASQTWESVLEEMEEEKRKAKGDNSDEDELAGVTTELFGWELPQWIVGFQLSLKQADTRIDELILEEYDAQVWNYTKDDLIPPKLDPGLYPGSPELTGVDQGVDLGASLCDGLVLSPLLFGAYLKYSDPLYTDDDDDDDTLVDLADLPAGPIDAFAKTSTTTQQQDLQAELDNLKSLAQERLDQIDDRIRKNGSQT